MSVNIPNRALPDAELLEGMRLPGLNWDDFRIFLAVVEIGSIHRAAEAVGLSQPTTSRRLTRLEDVLGVRLFDRDRAGTRLTQEGRRVYNEISAARFALARAARATQHPNRNIEGDCKIVMGDGLATYWLPYFVGRFFELHPNIELKLFVSQDSFGSKNEIFDIQLHYFEPVEANPISVRLGTLQFIPFATRDYLEKYGRPGSIEDLSQHRLLGHTSYLIDKGAWATWTNETQAQFTSLLTNQSGPLVECVKQGAGIALLPTYLAVTDERLVPLYLGAHFPLPIFMSYQRGAAMKWPVRSFLNFMKDAVINRKTMPWFADKFEQPGKNWEAVFDARTKRVLTAI
jgi:DNA-binding transcriptional LysR family regulator